MCMYVQTEKDLRPVVMNAVHCGPNTSISNKETQSEGKKEGHSKTNEPGDETGK